jgi:hypothetical protein
VSSVTGRGTFTKWKRYTTVRVTIWSLLQTVYDTKRYKLHNGMCCVNNGTVIKCYVLQNGNVTKLDVTTRYMLLDSTFSILYYECTNPWIT